MYDIFIILVESMIRDLMKLFLLFAFVFGRPPSKVDTGLRPEGVIFVHKLNQQNCQRGGQTS